jgi:RND family efflux transporter MFP subunit
MNKSFIGMAALALVAAGLYWQGLPPFAQSPSGHAAPREPSQKTRAPAARDEAAPSVTVVRAAAAPLKETLLVTGTLVPRLEVLVAPEVEGLRVTELLVEEGTRVAKGQVLARLEKETLLALLAQNDAALAKTRAAITQAQSNIAAAEARKVETSNALDRARPLSKTGVLSDSTLDQREAAARTAIAQLRVAEDGLKVAEAERAQVEAQRRDIEWKLSRTEVRAPVAGVVSRRNARIGAMASGTAAAQPMFNLIASGEIELEAEVPETDLNRLKAGQQASVSTAGSPEAKGTVRLVMPEVDKATRQGRVRIAIADGTNLHIGSFARGTVLVRSANVLVLPSSAVLFGLEGAYVQVVKDDRVISRKVVPGVLSGDQLEIVSGLAPGEAVVAKAGTFLRSGDRIVPVEPRSGTVKVN